MAENREILWRLIAASVNRPVTTVLISVILTACWAIEIGSLKYGTDVSNVRPDSLPEKILYDQLGVLFPSKEVIVVGIEDENLLNRRNIARLNRITRGIEKISQIDSVLSPTNVRLVEVQNDGVRVRRAAGPLPATDEQATDLRRRLQDQPLVMDTLLPQNGKAALMLAFVKAKAKGAYVAARIVELANDPKRNEGLTVHVAGRLVSAFWSKKVTRYSRFDDDGVGRHRRLVVGDVSQPARRVAARRHRCRLGVVDARFHGLCWHRLQPYHRSTSHTSAREHKVERLPFR